MEKEAQSDSLTTVTIKPEYAPSEVYSSEPPPAYHRSQSSAVQVAKIIAVTVVLVSVVLGGFILASAYVTANASCRQLEQELELLSEAADRFQGPLPPEALIQAEPLHQKQQTSTVEAEESNKNVHAVDNNSVDSSDSDSSDSSSSSSSESEGDERTPIHFKLPLQLDFDDLAGALIEKNQKSRMNCVVEKKRAEELINHQSKTLTLPFGLNLTTDPKLERLSGERMAIFCESGNLRKQTPDDDDDDSDEETIMIQPVMIPIPQTHYPTHMAQQMSPMEAMRPPVPPFMRQQEEQNQLPPNQILHRIAQELIARKIMEARRAAEEQAQAPEQNQRFITPEMMAQRFPIPEEILSQINRLPNREVIVAVSQQDSDEASQETPEMRIVPQEIRVVPQQLRPVQQEMEQAQQEMRRPIPQELPQIQQEMRQIPQEMRQIPQEMRQIPQEMRQIPQQMRQIPQEMRPTPQQMHAIVQERRIPQPIQAVAQELHVFQQPRENAQEMNGRQTYAGVVPVHIPVHMVQQEQGDSQNAQVDEPRPHYVQPRSVRSVDALLPKSQKRVKRCSCDCAC